MFREKMDKVFSSKSFYIIFSLLTAIALWLYVSYAANPDVTIPVAGIPIEYSGAGVLQDKNLIITDIDVDVVTLRFQGKRTNVSKLITSAPTVTVDLSTISGSGTYQLQYDIKYPSDVNESMITVVGGSVDYVTVYVEKLIEKKVVVEGIYSGGAQEGYSAQPVEFEPGSIVVSGPEDEVAKVHRAWVNIQRENLSKTVVEEMPFTLQDADGNEVKSELLTVDRDTITVTIPVLMEKEVSLVVNLIEGAGATSANTTVHIEPSTVTLTGDAETLNDCNQIVLGTIDLTKFSASTTQKFTIAIPNDTTNITGVNEATVTVEIAGLATTRLSATNITVTNNTNGYTAELITQSLDVTIRGTQEQIAQITADNVNIVADLSDIGEATGSMAVPAKVYVYGFTGAGAIGDYSVSVRLTKNQSQNQ